MSTPANDFDAGFEKPVSNMWKPGKEGDVIKGVYVGFKEVDSKFNDEKTKIHEVTAIAGSFHNVTEDASGANVVDENATEVKADESYVFYEKSTFADDIAKAVPGQKVIVRFIEWRKPKSGGKPYKYVECKLDKTFKPDAAGADGEF